MSLTLVLQLCAAYLARLTLIVFVMGGWWPFSFCFGGFCLQDFFSIDQSILLQLPSSFFSIGLVRVHVVHLYSSIDTSTASVSRK